VPPLPPVDEYALRLALRQAAAAARERTHIHLGNAKVAVFIGALIYGAVTLGGDPSRMVWAAAVAVYLALAVWHELTIRALTRAQAAVRFYSDGTARICSAGQFGQNSVAEFAAPGVRRRTNCSWTCPRWGRVSSATTSRTRPTCRSRR